jgi:hypothetical protein
MIVRPILFSRAATIAGVLFASHFTLTALPAHAAILQFDLTLTYLTPPNPILPAGNLTGTPQFFSDNGVIDHLLPIASPPPPILPLGQTYFASFIPTDPCFGQASCAISFSFDGLAQGFPAAAFLTGNIPSARPQPPPILPIAVLQPGDPCPPGDPCRASGLIVAFDDPVVIGTWDVSIHPTPLPGALPLFASGLAALGVMGCRRKRKVIAA